MKLRRLTDIGLIKFNEYLDSLKTEPTRLVPYNLLDSIEDSESVVEIDVAALQFKTRYEAAEYLDSLLAKAEINDASRDEKLWAWLTLFYFDSLCPPDKSGARKTRERAAYIPEPQNFQRYYRHLLLGSFLIYRAHRDNPSRAMALLCKPPHIIDDVVGQLAARQEFVTNRALVELATTLYYDPVLKTIKRGAGGKGAGSPRRLTAVLGQFDLTWDLYATTLKEFLDVLPTQFTKFVSV